MFSGQAHPLWASTGNRPLRTQHPASMTQCLALVGQKVKKRKIYAQPSGLQPLFWLKGEPGPCQEESSPHPFSLVTLTGNVTL